jgi:WD40 repeat protein
LWDIKIRQKIGVLRCNSFKILSAALTSNSETVVSGSKDKTVRVWSVKKIELLFILTEHTEWVNQAGISRDDKYIVSGSKLEECVRVWENESENEVC